MAISAVIVAGGSILANYLQSNKRLRHDARMQAERLAHEADAARAYPKAAEVDRWVSFGQLEVVGKGDRVGPEEHAPFKATYGAILEAEALHGLQGW